MDESYSININSSDSLLNSTHIDKSISDLSKLEREINQLQSHNTQPYINIKDELLNSIIEDQREQIIFLKYEIRFLRDECKEKRKYIEMLDMIRIENTTSEISIDVIVRKSKSVTVQMNNDIASHLDKQLKDVRAEKHQTYKETYVSNESP